MAMWARLATEGAPANASAWAPYTNGSDSGLRLAVREGGGLQMERHPRAALCDFWDELLDNATEHSV